jgi:hypothetical protein
MAGKWETYGIAAIFRSVGVMKTTLPQTKPLNQINKA